MIPTKRLMGLVALAALPFVGSIFIPEIWTIGWMINLMIMLLSVVDLLITPSPTHLEIIREVSDVLSVGDTNPVTFRLQNQSKYALEVDLTDETPTPGESDGLPLHLKLPPWKQVDARYTFSRIVAATISSAMFICGTPAGLVFGNDSSNAR